MKSASNHEPRSGCKDIWNAFMVKNAKFDIGSDMPICISSDVVPESVISFEDAESIYRREMKRKNKSFYVNSFIHFFISAILQEL